MADIQVEVCYAHAEVQFLRTLSLPEGATLRDAIEGSGVLQEFPEIDLSVNRVGIFGKQKDLDAALRHGDRAELYRPLVADPMESRRKRASKKEALKSR